MPDRLPSLKALRIFEAAARRLSYSRAAEELFLTHGAVSHQIKALEGELGTQLFRRAGRSMVLTEEGQRLYLPMHEALAMVAKGVAEVRRDDRPQTLNVSTTPSLAIGWLIPRLADFRRRHPRIEVNLDSAIALVDFNRDDVDLALRYGHGAWPDVCAERLPLTDIEYFAVCSPAYRDSKSPQTLEELGECTLIHHPFMSWEEWFRSAGVAEMPPMRGPRFNEYGLSMQAAVAGHGVMLANGILVADEMARGGLVRVLPCQPALRKSSAFYVVYAQDRELPPKTRLFRDWLVAQARKDTRLESAARQGDNVPPQGAPGGTTPAHKTRA